MWLRSSSWPPRAWAAVGVVPAAAAAACRARAPKVDGDFVAGGGRARTGDRPRRGRLRRRGPGSAIGPPEGSWIHYGLTSSDVVDTALCATLARAADLLLDAVRRPGGGAEGPGPRAHRRPGGRPDPRHARRADHLRGQVRPVGPAGRPRPPAACGRPARPGGGGQAVGGGRDLLQHRPRGRGLRLRGPRAPPVPATQVIARDRHAEYL